MARTSKTSIRRARRDADGSDPPPAAEAAVVIQREDDDAHDEEHQSMFSTLNNGDLAKTLAPAVGAAVGTAAITAAVERLEAPRERVAIGGALLAFTIAQNTEGALKQALIGAGSAGVCIALRELIELRRPKLLYGDKPKPEPVAATPPDAITRGDLANALADVHAQLAKQAHAREQRDQEIQSMVRGLLAELAGARAEIQRLRSMSQRSRNDAGRAHLSVARPPQPPPEVADDDSAPTVGNTAVNQAARGPEPVGSDAATLPPPSIASVPQEQLADAAAAIARIPANHVSRIMAVRERLSPDEWMQLVNRFGTMSHDELDALEVALVSAPSVDAALEHLRNTVLPPPKAA